MTLHEMEASLEGVKQRWHYRLYLDGLNLDIGTAGSGNWGHAGRKGLRGGSAPGGGTAHRISAEGGGYTSKAKQRQAEKKKKAEENQCPTLKKHLPEKDEFKSVSLRTEVRVYGGKHKGTKFYPDGKGGLVNPETGEHLTQAQIKKQGLETSYREPAYERPKFNTKEARAEYKAGKSPFEQMTVHSDGLSAKLCEGMEVTGTNGKTYRAVKGKWREIGPGGETASPKDLPISKLAWAHGSPDVIEGSFTGDLYTIALRTKGLSEQETAKMASDMRGCPEKLRSRFTAALADVPAEMITKDNKKYASGTCYTPGIKKVFFERGTTARTMIHEFGHAMDDAANGILSGGSMSKKINHEMTEQKKLQDRLSVFDAVGVKHDQYGNIKEDKYSAAMKYLAWGAKHSGMRNFRRVSDIISSTTMNKLHETQYGGHSSGYWYTWGSYKNMGNHVGAEQWAQFVLLKATNDTEGLQLVEQLMPRLSATLNKIYEEEFGG